MGEGGGCKSGVPPTCLLSLTREGGPRVDSNQPPGLGTRHNWGSHSAARGLAARYQEGLPGLGKETHSPSSPGGAECSHQAPS